VSPVLRVVFDIPLDGQPPADTDIDKVPEYVRTYVLGMLIPMTHLNAVSAPDVPEAQIHWHASGMDACQKCINHATDGVS
jgi:hypothetical protein